MDGYTPPPGWPDPVPEWPAGPAHLAYRAIQSNLTRLLQERPGAAGVLVPACPGWTVHDVVAHLLRICRSTSDGPEVGYAGPPGPGLPELLQNWGEATDDVEQAIVEGRRPRAPMLVMDAFSHQIDILQALGLSVPPREHPAWPIALHVATIGFSFSIMEHGQAGLRLETPGVSWDVGAGEPIATVRDTHPVMLRALTGRRSVGEIAAMDWSADPDPWLTSFFWGPFVPPQDAAPAV